MPCDLLVRADVIVTQDDARSIIHGAGVAISDGLIVEVGGYTKLDAGYVPDARLDLSGKLLLPGLINGHTHLPMTLFRGFADDLPLMEWLENHIWPIEFQLSDEILEIGARIGCAELIRTGCTAFINGYFHEYITGDAASEAGIRAVLGEGFFSFPSPHFPDADACWQVNRTLAARYEANPLIRTAITPHAAFTVTPDELVESFELAKELDIPWQTHLSESPAETEIVIGKYGKRPVELLHDLGILSERTTLHHCVDVTEEEIAILAETGTNVVHNPASNLKLCSGISPVQRMLDAGITIGLGTDGASSNNQLNMFRDMNIAALIGKIRHESASAVNAESVLDMATRGSAKCLGWPALGRIEKGCPADLIAIDLSSPNMLPMYSPISHAVYATTGMEVCMTMVAGEILFLFDDFKTMDVKLLWDEALRAKKWINDKAEKGKVV